MIDTLVSLLRGRQRLHTGGPVTPTTTVVGEPARPAPVRDINAPYACTGCGAGVHHPTQCPLCMAPTALRPRGARGDG